MEFLDDGLEVYGINNNIPNLTEYFKEFDFQIYNDQLNVEEKIERILSIAANLQVGEIEIIKTPIMISNDGVYFSGYKLKIELFIDYKIKCLIQSDTNFIKFVNDKLVKTIYVVIPLEYENISTIDLLRRRKIIVNPYLEDIYSVIKKKNNIYTNISALVVVDFADIN